MFQALLLEARFETKIAEPEVAAWVRRIRLARMFPGWTRAETEALNGDDIQMISAIIAAENRLKSQ